MKKNIILLFAITCGIQSAVGFVNADMNGGSDGKLFYDFLNKFPTLRWTDLDSLKKIKKDDLGNCDTISIEDANMFIWYKSSPKIRLKDNSKRSYMRGYMGVFDSSQGLRYDENIKDWIPSGEFSKLYPLARVDLYDDVVLLIIGYKYLYETSFKFSIEAYILKKSIQQCTSSFCFSGDNPANTILYGDMRISSYEGYDGVTEDIMEHYVYKIDSDGFMVEEESYLDVAYSYGIISDADGYVNVRNETTTNSKILYTISDSTRIVFFKIPKSNWAEIIRVDDESDHEGGFVHISRIKDFR